MMKTKEIKAMMIQWLNIAPVDNPDDYTFSQIMDKPISERGLDRVLSLVGRDIAINFDSLQSQLSEAKAEIERQRNANNNLVSSYQEIEKEQVQRYCCCGDCTPYEYAYSIENFHSLQSQLSEAKAELSQLNNGWVSVDGTESQLTERGHYWWNPRYAVNQGEFHWTVIYSDPKNGQEKQGVFVGPIPSPPKENRE